MTTSIPSKQEVLAKRIAKAEQELLVKRNSTDPYEEDIAVLFTGNHHDAIPRHLIVNEELSANEKITWQVLRAGLTDPNRPGSIARRSDLARAVNCSAPTITTNRAMLRVQRWMTFCKQVRKQGQFVGDIYLLHDEPLSIMSTLEIDPTYIGFLELQQQSKNKRIRDLSSRILNEIANQLSDNPTTELEVLAARMSRLNQSKNFAPVETPQEFNAQTENLSALSEYEALTEGDLHQSKKLSLDDDNQSKNFAPAEKISFISSFSGSSSIVNISTHAREEITQERLNAIETFRDLEDSLGSFEKRYSYSETERLLKQYFPELLHRALMPYVLSVLNVSNIALIALKFRGFDSSEKLMVMLQIIGRQAAYKHGWSDPIVNLLGYSAALINAHRQGRFQPDDWALKLMTAMKTNVIPEFTDSPDLMARKRLGGISV
jgi:hypothetical protein